MTFWLCFGAMVILWCTFVFLDLDTDNIGLLVVTVAGILTFISFITGVFCICYLSEKTERVESLQKLRTEIKALDSVDNKNVEIIIMINEKVTTYNSSRNQYIGEGKAMMINYSMFEDLPELVYDTANNVVYER